MSLINGYSDREDNDNVEANTVKINKNNNDIAKLTQGSSVIKIKRPPVIL